jgi:polyisoprenoid-binding protein YceI
MRTRLRVALYGWLTAGVLLPAPLSAAPADATPVSRASAVGFTVYVKALFTIKQEGQFTDFDGQVTYDPADPAATRLNLTVYTASVDTHDASHDEMLRSADFFDVARYPTMHFVTTQVSVGQDGHLAVAGDLTIRGVTRRLEVPVTIRRAFGLDPVTGTRFEATFDIDRTDFGLNGSPKYGGLNISVAKKVRIHLALMAAPQR